MSKKKKLCSCGHSQYNSKAKTMEIYHLILKIMKEEIQNEKEKFVKDLIDKFHIIPKTDNPEKWIETYCTPKNRPAKIDDDGFLDTFDGFDIKLRWRGEK